MIVRLGTVIYCLGWLMSLSVAVGKLIWPLLTGTFVVGGMDYSWLTYMASMGIPIAWNIRYILTGETKFKPNYPGDEYHTKDNT